MENETKPIYKKTWFQIVAGLFTVLIIVGAFGNKEENEQDELNEIINETTDSSLEVRFIELYNKFPKIVFNTNDKFVIRVTEKNKLTLIFEVSEHYDYSTDEKLKQYMITESLKALSKLNDLESINLGTNYNNNSYNISLDRKEVESYLSNIPKISKDDLKVIWNQYSINK